MIVMQRVFGEHEPVAIASLKVVGLFCGTGGLSNG